MGRKVPAKGLRFGEGLGFIFFRVCLEALWQSSVSDETFQSEHRSDTGRGSEGRERRRCHQGWISVPTDTHSVADPAHQDSHDDEASCKQREARFEHDLNTI